MYRSESGKHRLDFLLENAKLRIDLTQTYLLIEAESTLAALDGSEAHLGQKFGSNAKRVSHRIELLHSFLE